MVKRQTIYINGYKTVQFKDNQYILGIINFSKFHDCEEVMDAEDFDEFLNYFIKRDERTSYCCDNCTTIGIIRDPSSVDLSQFDFKTGRSPDMFLYVLQDDNSEREIIMYLDTWCTGGLKNPPFISL